MNLEEIQLLWEEDSKLDPDNLHSESIKIPSLHAKYYKIYNNILLLKKMEENKFKILRKEKWMYYSGKSDPEVYKEKHRIYNSILNPEIQRSANHRPQCWTLPYREDRPLEHRIYQH